VTGDHTQARLQRIEERVASLDDTVSILAAVDDELAKKRIVDTFEMDPSMVIIYRGVQRDLTQARTAGELRTRGLQRANQARVSTARAFLEEQGFLKKTQTGYSVREGWAPFGIERYLRQVLRATDTADLG
jgi:hypothetical protein